MRSPFPCETADKGRSRSIVFSDTNLEINQSRPAERVGARNRKSVIGMLRPINAAAVTPAGQTFTLLSIVPKLAKVNFAMAILRRTIPTKSERHATMMVSWSSPRVWLEWM